MKGWNGYRVWLLPVWLFVLGGCATSPSPRPDGAGGKEEAPPPACYRMARYVPDVPLSERPFSGTGVEGTNAAHSKAAVSASGNTTGGADVPLVFRRLRRGDRLTVSLRGIPNPQDINEEVDNKGNISLDFLGEVHVEGLTTSEAEQKIRKLYIDNDYYKDVTVVIVSQADEYYVRGEVNAPGKYPLTGDITLMMAISSAGDFTDFANKKRVIIYRRGKQIEVDARRIESGRAKDIPIEPNDIIWVSRRRI